MALLACQRRGCYTEPLPDCGVVDSLRYLLRHEDYNIPYGEHNRLATLLVKTV